MALSKEDLQALSDLMDVKLAPLTKDVAELKADVAVLKAEMEHNTRSDQRFETFGARILILEHRASRSSCDSRRAKKYRG